MLPKSSMVCAAICSLLVPVCGFGSRMTVGRTGESRLEDAQTAAPAARAAPPSRVLTDEERADIFMARKQYDDAIGYYQRALRLPNADRGMLWNKVGIAWQQEGYFSRARNAYERAIHFNRAFAAAWNNLGTTYYLNHKPKPAIKYYRQAIRLDPRGASLHLNLGTAYYARKQYKPAVEEYRAALVLDPDILRQHSRTGSVVEAANADAEYYFYLAKVFASLGRNQEAVRYLEHAMESGFKNYKRIENDSDLQKLKNFPPYVALMKNPPTPIKN